MAQLHCEYTHVDVCSLSSHREPSWALTSPSSLNSGPPYSPTPPRRHCPFQRSPCTIHRRWTGAGCSLLQRAPLTPPPARKGPLPSITKSSWSCHLRHPGLSALRGTAIQSPKLSPRPPSHNLNTVSFHGLQKVLPRANEHSKPVMPKARVWGMPMTDMDEMEPGF